jgi:hypothetical protein
MLVAFLKRGADRITGSTKVSERELDVLTELHPQLWSKHGQLSRGVKLVESPVVNGKTVVAVRLKFNCLFSWGMSILQITVLQAVCKDRPFGGWLRSAGPVHYTTTQGKEKVLFGRQHAAQVFKDGLLKIKALHDHGYLSVYGDSVASILSL